MSQAESPTKEGGERKVRTGVVVSDAMEKTVVVRISHQVRHRMYGKIVRRSTKLQAHDEAGDAHVGDTVRIVETRPLSKTKRWRVVEVIERAK
jgi:small subunit ribosomal protein S17